MKSDDMELVARWVVRRSCECHHVHTPSNAEAVGLCRHRLRIRVAAQECLLSNKTLFEMPLLDTCRRGERLWGAKATRCFRPAEPCLALFCANTQLIPRQLLVVTEALRQPARYLKCDFLRSRVA
jgi:hypothetical protein